jgi:Kef-type K+ transport system membrane component KefB
MISPDNIFIFLLQFLLLLGCARLLGEVFSRLRQPAVTAEILIGIIFGPSILGRFFPQIRYWLFPSDPIQTTMFSTVAWLGAFFLLLEIGLEMDFSSAWRQRGEALIIAITDIVVPMSLAFTACLFLPAHYLPESSKQLVFFLFMAMVMTISAMPIAARALRELNVHKTDLGFLILSALSVNEIIGWLIFSVVLGLFAGSTGGAGNLFLLLAVILGFTVLCLSFGRKAADYLVAKIQKMKIAEPAASLSLACVLGCLCGAVTQKIGISPLFGFFVAGVTLGGAKSLPERTRHVISQMVYALFVPLFFVNVGLEIDFVKNFDLFLCLFVALFSLSGKFIGAWFGSGIAGVPKSNRLPLAIAHIPGGPMEIVAGMLAMQFGIINSTVFVAIVFSALFSSIIFGPALAWAINSRKKISVAEFFYRRSVIAGAKYDSRDEVIRELCERAAESLEGRVAFEEIFRAVKEREKLISTGMEFGLAFPHARLDNLKHPLVFFARSLSGVDWNSLDGSPAHHHK